MAKKVNKSQLEILEREKKQTLTELQNLKDELKSEVEHDDIDDIASDLIERDKIQALIFNLQRKVEDIEYAIEQVKDGEYGICERCRKAIDPERLEIFPETTHCIDCKRIIEARSFQYQR